MTDQTDNTRRREALGPRPEIAAIAPYSSPQLSVSYRMNANEAPEPPPQAFVEALKDEIEQLTFNRYPDRAALGLREAIGGFHGVEASDVYSANGSNEVLQSLMLAYAGPGRAVATFEPTYAMYSHIARILGTAVLCGERNDDFFVDIGEFERVLRDGAAIGDGNPTITFLCSPNNPTGKLEPRAVIEEVLERAPGIVVVDEAYGQFASWSALELHDAYPRLVVVRTFSKTWSLAGLRLGYAVAHPTVIAALESVTLPYHLDAQKQVAGRLALDFDDAMRRRVSRLVEERGRLMARLQELDVTVCPSDANFILFLPNHRDGKKIWDTLVEEHSVLIRDVSSWPRLEGYLRVTVGTKEENDAFLDALTKALN